MWRLERGGELSGIAVYSSMVMTPCKAVFTNRKYVQSLNSANVRNLGLNTSYVHTNTGWLALDVPSDQKKNKWLQKSNLKENE
jgi:hypothetical protein